MMIRRRSVVVAAAVALALLLAGTAAACSSADGDSGGSGSSARSGELTVTDAWASPGEVVAAVYLEVDNGGDDDRLVGASADRAASVTVMGEAGGEAGSHGGEAEAVDLAIPSGTTAFRPGERHVMLDGLERPLRAGDQLELTLEFERNGVRTVDVDVLAWEDVVERAEDG